LNESNWHIPQRNKLKDPYGVDFMETLEKVEDEFTKMNRAIREIKLPGCKTAMGVATHRAVESARPEEERICYDPYAVYFLSPELRRAK